MKPIKAKKVRCNLCGENNSNFLFESHDRQYNNPEIFKLVRCRRCGLVYLNPRPLKFEKYYPSCYEPFRLPKVTFPESLTSKFLSSERYYKKNKNSIDQILSKVFEWLYSPVPNSLSGKILDVGCGSGAKLYGLKKRGWDVYGVDTSLDAVDFAKKKLNLEKVYLGTIESKKFPPGFFNAVLLSHVIEHLQDPKKTLREIKRILKPEGLLIITTPNFASLNSKIFRQFWFPLETPRHLYLFTPSTLIKLLSSVGLVTLGSSFNISSYSFAKSLGYFLGNKDRINNLLMKLKFFFLPITYISSLIKRSDIFTVYVEIKNNNQKNHR